MFNDLIDLFGGWYSSYAAAIRDLLQVTNTDSDGITTVSNPAIWSAYVPWEQLIAAVVLVVFIVVFFKFMRSVLCKMF